MTLEEHTLLNSAAILQLSQKVDKQMSAIEDLRAAEAELSAVVDASVAVIADLTHRLEAVGSADAEIVDVAARLRNLKDVLASHTGVEPAPAPVQG